MAIEARRGAFREPVSAGRIFAVGLATLLLSEQHESIVDVQKHLGHADIRSTMVYAQLTDEANRERAERLRDWR